MDNYIEKRVELKAPLSRVWRALTDHRQFGAWFGVEIDGPFVVGEFSTGRITIAGCEHVPWRVRIEALEAERYFAYRWRPYAIDPERDYSTETPTLVEFHLSPSQDGTLLRTCESGFDKLPQDRRAEAYRMNDGGWTAQLKNIEEYVTANA